MSNFKIFFPTLSSLIFFSFASFASNSHCQIQKSGRLLPVISSRPGEIFFSPKKDGTIQITSCAQAFQTIYVATNPKIGTILDNSENTQLDSGSCMVVERDAENSEIFSCDETKDIKLKKPTCFIQKKSGEIIWPKILSPKESHLIRIPDGGRALITCQNSFVTKGNFKQIKLASQECLVTIFNNEINLLQCTDPIINLNTKGIHHL